MSAGRRAARRTALFVLYQWDVTGQPLASLHEGEVDEYARSLAESVAARAPELDALITEAADGWTADRLGAVERNVLRIAVQELESGDVPEPGRDRRGRRPREALRERRGGAARQRDPRSDPARPGRRYAAVMSAEESLQRAEEPARPTRGCPRRGSEATEEPEAALEILG